MAPVVSLGKQWGKWSYPMSKFKDLSPEQQARLIKKDQFDRDVKRIVEDTYGSVLKHR